MLRTKEFNDDRHHYRQVTLVSTSCDQLIVSTSRSHITRGGSGQALGKVINVVTPIGQGVSEEMYKEHKSIEELRSRKEAPKQ